MVVRITLMGAGKYQLASKSLDGCKIKLAVSS